MQAHACDPPDVAHPDNAICEEGCSATSTSNRCDRADRPDNGPLPALTPQARPRPGSHRRGDAPIARDRRPRRRARPTRPARRPSAIEDEGPKRRSMMTHARSCLCKTQAVTSELVSRPSSAASGSIRERGHRTDLNLEGDLAAVFCAALRHHAVVVCVARGVRSPGPQRRPICLSHAIGVRVRDGLRHKQASRRRSTCSQLVRG